MNQNMKHYTKYHQNTKAQETQKQWAKMTQNHGPPKTKALITRPFLLFTRNAESRGFDCFIIPNMQSPEKKTQQRKHQSSLEYYKLCLNASQKLADEKMETYV